jgi:predicted nucleic acid-binding protein
MRLLFDTSILVAGFVASHPKHHLAIDWLKRIKTNEHSFYVAGHSLAECFAVLTKLPLSPKISPETAHYLIKENIEKLANIIVLSPSDYKKIIFELTELSLTGGIIYDAIILKAAKKAAVDKILTFNLRDFVKLIPNEPSFILSPSI